MSSVAKHFQRLQGKSARTLLFRGSQELRLALMGITGGWWRLEKKIAAHWSLPKTEAYIDEGPRHILVDPSALEAFSLLFREGLIDKEALLELGACIRARKFKILGQEVPAKGGFPWQTDWRFARVFPPRDYRHYDHHAARDIPYDVKYPWELSRLGFLLPLMQKALLERALGLSQGQIEEVFSILADFDEKNLYGHSVNWHPMEASMRVLTLVFLLEMALLAKISSAHAGLLLKMITKHGEYIWRNLEYTDHRGNHYAANIVALLVAGAALAGHYAPAQQWQLYACEHIEDEVLGQFLPDGVNFEKSLAYHRLVTELFMMAKIVMTRQKLLWGGEADRRLHEACLFAATARRLDGFAPVIGDTDDAVIFAFDPAPPRDPVSVLSLGAVLFDEPELKGALKRRPVSSALPWMLGSKGVEEFIHLPVKEFAGGRHFGDGGFMIVRRDQAFLMMDVGEVGQNGLGGHGHNDILSFELCLEGHALIVDPGCPVYTGDLAARKLFRSSAYHNMLVIDGQEVAELLSPFRIANDAVPFAVVYEESNGEYTLRGGHTGYRRLFSPVDHVRDISFHPQGGKFSCDDKLTVFGRHRAERYFHFAPEVVLQMGDNALQKGIVATLYQHRFHIFFDDYSTAEILQGRVSAGYGQVTEAPILKLSTEIAGSVTLSFHLLKL